MTGDGVSLSSAESRLLMAVRERVPSSSMIISSSNKFLLVMDGNLLSRELAEAFAVLCSVGLEIIVEIRLLILCTKRLWSLLFGRVATSSYWKAELEWERGMWGEGLGSGARSE